MGGRAKAKLGQGKGFVSEPMLDSTNFNSFFNGSRYTPSPYTLALKNKGIMPLSGSILNNGADAGIGLFGSGSASPYDKYWRGRTSSLLSAGTNSGASGVDDVRKKVKSARHGDFAKQGLAAVNALGAYAGWKNQKRYLDDLFNVQSKETMLEAEQQNNKYLAEAGMAENAAENTRDQRREMTGNAYRKMKQEVASAVNALGKKGIVANGSTVNAIGSDVSQMREDLQRQENASLSKEIAEKNSAIANRANASNSTIAGRNKVAVLQAERDAKKREADYAFAGNIVGNLIGALVPGGQYVSKIVEDGIASSGKTNVDTSHVKDFEAIGGGSNGFGGYVDFDGNVSFDEPNKLGWDPVLNKQIRTAGSLDSLSRISNTQSANWNNKLGELGNVDPIVSDNSDDGTILGYLDYRRKNHRRRRHGR